MTVKEVIVGVTTYNIRASARLSIYKRIKKEKGNVHYTEQSNLVKGSFDRWFKYFRCCFFK